MRVLIPLCIACFGTTLLAGDTVVTPEPATAGLAVMSLAGLGLALWRRNRNGK